MNIDNKGILSSLDFTEYLIEPDGSVWYQICHHTNPTAYKFSSSSDFMNGIYIDENRWFHANICNELTSWEFLWIQQLTINGEKQKFRWTQSKNPFTATYTDVAPGTATYNTSAGYNASGGVGGMYKLNSNTFFCIANGTSGNWWGAVGAWNAHNGGIPGHHSSGVITDGTLNLYVRIDNNKQKFQFRNLDIINANNFYEY